jgi:hypothetical protein
MIKTEGRRFWTHQFVIASFGRCVDLLCNEALRFEMKAEITLQLILENNIEKSQTSKPSSENTFQVA